MTLLPNKELLLRFVFLRKHQASPKKNGRETRKKVSEVPPKKSSVFTRAVPAWFTGGVSRWSPWVAVCYPWHAMDDWQQGGGKISLNKQGGWNKITNIFPKWWWKMVIYHGRIRKTSSWTKKSINWDTLPETNSLPLDIGHSKRKGLSSNHNFSGGYVKLPGCNKKRLSRKTPMNGCVQLICFLYV